MARKEYLDFSGLKFYDEYIKKLIKSGIIESEAELQKLATAIAGESIRAKAAEDALATSYADLDSQLEWEPLGSKNIEEGE